LPKDVDEGGFRVTISANASGATGRVHARFGDRDEIVAPSHRPVADVPNQSGDVVSDEGTRRRTARGDERKKGNRLLVARNDWNVESDSDFIREQDP
jgi:hypothetical protein